MKKCTVCGQNLGDLESKPAEQLAKSIIDRSDQELYLQVCQLWPSHIVTADDSMYWDLYAGVYVVCTNCILDIVEQASRLLESEKKVVTVERKQYTDMSGVPTSGWSECYETIENLPAEVYKEYSDMLDTAGDTRENIWEMCARLFSEGWTNNELEVLGMVYLFRGIEEGWIYAELGITQLGGIVI